MAVNIQKLEEAIALLKDADACQQAADLPAADDVDVCYDIHCSIEELIDQLEDIRDETIALAR